MPTFEIYQIRHIIENGSPYNIWTKIEEKEFSNLTNALEYCDDLETNDHNNIKLVNQSKDDTDPDWIYYYAQDKNPAPAKKVKQLKVGAVLTKFPGAIEDLVNTQKENDKSEGLESGTDKEIVSQIGKELRFYVEDGALRFDEICEDALS